MRAWLGRHVEGIAALFVMFIFFWNLFWLTLIVLGIIAVGIGVVGFLLYFRKPDPATELPP